MSKECKKESSCPLLVAYVNYGGEVGLRITSTKDGAADIYRSMKPIAPALYLHKFDIDVASPYIFSMEIRQSQLDIVRDGSLASSSRSRNAYLQPVYDSAGILLLNLATANICYQHHQKEPNELHLCDSDLACVMLHNCCACEYTTRFADSSDGCSIAKIPPDNIELNTHSITAGDALYTRHEINYIHPPFNALFSKEQHQGEVVSAANEMRKNVDACGISQEQYTNIDVSAMEESAALDKSGLLSFPCRSSVFTEQDTVIFMTWGSDHIYRLESSKECKIGLNQLWSNPSIPSSLPDIFEEPPQNTFRMGPQLRRLLLGAKLTRITNEQNPHEITSESYSHINNDVNEIPENIDPMFANSWFSSNPATCRTEEKDHVCVEKKDRVTAVEKEEEDTNVEGEKTWEQELEKVKYGRDAGEKEEWEKEEETATYADVTDIDRSPVTSEDETKEHTSWRMGTSSMTSQNASLETMHSAHTKCWSDFPSISPHRSPSTVRTQMEDMTLLARAPDHPEAKQPAHNTDKQPRNEYNTTTEPRVHLQAQAQSGAPESSNECPPLGDPANKAGSPPELIVVIPKTRLFRRLFGVKSVRYAGSIDDVTGNADAEHAPPEAVFKKSVKKRKSNDNHLGLIAPEIISVAQPVSGCSNEGMLDEITIAALPDPGPTAAGSHQDDSSMKHGKRRNGSVGCGFGMLVSRAFHRISKRFRNLFRTAAARAEPHLSESL